MATNLLAEFELGVWWEQIATRLDDSYTTHLLSLKNAFHRNYGGSVTGRGFNHGNSFYAGRTSALSLSAICAIRLILTYCQIRNANEIT